MSSHGCGRRCFASGPLRRHRVKTGTPSPHTLMWTDVSRVVAWAMLQLPNWSSHRRSILAGFTGGAGCTVTHPSSVLSHTAREGRQHYQISLGPTSTCFQLSCQDFANLWNPGVFQLNRRCLRTQEDKAKQIWLKHAANRLAVLTCVFFLFYTKSWPFSQW